MNSQDVKNLKNSCFALGITLKDKSHLLDLFGSGFMIREDGFFITAKHVIDSLYNAASNYQKRGIKTDFRIFYNTIVREDSKSISKLIAHKVSYGMDIPTSGYTKDDIPFTVDLDTHIGRVEGNDSFAHLNFEVTTKIKILDPILMCGYPVTNQSIELNSKTETRWSPILQPGIISSLLPVDESTQPYGIQTDIIGTGGSSGSPIVDAHTGIVLGMAQKILLTKTNIQSLICTIGLTYGISNFYLPEIIPTAITQMKSEIDDMGKALPHINSGDKTHLSSRIVFSDVYHE